MKNHVLTFFLLLSFSAFTASAQNSTSQEPLYIIFDGSNSMWGELPDKSRKIEAAKEVFNSLDPNLFSNREIALRLYGHRRPSDCADTELAVPFQAAEEALSRVSDKVNEVTPRGKTPIARSLKAALSDFAGRSGEILLISDGIETCDIDPCELVRSWKEDKIDIRVHVVGLGLSDISRGAMQCIAEASGTVYRDANSAKDLTQAIETTASEKNLEPGEPEPVPKNTGPEFKIKGVDENGIYVPVLGTISKPGWEEEIASNYRYVFEGGQYTITVGVPTVNGEIYEPIEEQIEIKDTGTTQIQVVLKRPPTARTRFLEKGEEVRGVLARAYVKETTCLV